MSARLFHVVPRAAWDAFLSNRAGAWAPPSLAVSGFVHLSFAPQLAGTLAAHFAAADALVLVEVDAAGLGAALRLEPGRAGAPFPHAYAALPRAALVRAWVLARAPSGAWGLPRLAREPSADDPPGAPLAPT